jgi:hypothetical protein
MVTPILRGRLLVVEVATAVLDYHFLVLYTLEAGVAAVAMQVLVVLVAEALLGYIQALGQLIVKLAAMEV